MPTNYSIIFPKRQQATLVSSSFDETPGPNEIIGKTIVSIVSSGSETGGFMGYGGGEGHYPCETGYANIMEITETGNLVSQFQPGDYVFTQSPHRLYNKVDADRVFLIPKQIVPGNITPEEAVICRFPAVSMTALFSTCVKPTEPVLVIGLGIVGLMCAQTLHHWGYEVYAVDPCESRQVTARNCRIPHTAASVNQFDLAPKTLGLTVDCTGNESAIMSAIPYMRHGGELALVGVPWRCTSDITAHTLLREIFYSYLHVYSGFEWSLPFKSSEFHPNSSLRSMETALKWIADGSIITKDIYELFDPRDCERVYPALADHSLEKPCVIFDWRKM